MWCLGRHLPLLIASFIPEGHPHRENFLVLLSIIDHVFAPITTSGGFREGARGAVAPHHHLPSQDIQKDGCCYKNILEHTNSCK